MKLKIVRNHTKSENIIILLSQYSWDFANNVFWVYKSNWIQVIIEVTVLHYLIMYNLRLLLKIL